MVDNILSLPEVAKKKKLKNENNGVSACGVVGLTGEGLIISGTHGQGANCIKGAQELLVSLFVTVVC